MCDTVIEILKEQYDGLNLTKITSINDYIKPHWNIYRSLWDIKFSEISKDHYEISNLTEISRDNYEISNLTEIPMYL